MKKHYFLLCLAVQVVSAASSQTSIIPYGSSWKYLDNGTNQGTAWRASAFNDAAWASGNAQLGYGDGDEATVVSYGPNANQKYTTTYFRRAITVANPAAFASLLLSIKRDDGAVVYINGTERFRSNMPSGNISYTTRASTDAADDGNTPQTITLASSVLVAGTNVIAVEIHQRTASSSDITFDLQLTGAGDVTPPTVTTYFPADNAVNVAVNSSLVLTFNEAVQKGTGNILIKEAGIVMQTIDVTSALVAVSANTVTITPSLFTIGAAVNIEMAAGAFKDLSNNNYAGIASATTWNFSIAIPDIIPPFVNTYSPLDNATGISSASNLVLTFNEPVQKGTGTIQVKEAGVVTQTIDVSSAVVTVSSNTVTINPSDFTYNASVNIEISGGAFKDMANNNYAGIADAATWNFTVQPEPSGPQTFIAYGASWKYLDNGTNQGTAWRGTGFNDAAWASGNAQLGYGDGDETTVVSYGPSANAKYITTYFRKTVNIANPANFTAFNGSVKRDDGVVIYVNGTEVYRSNMPTGTISYTTAASSAASDDGNTAQNFSLSPSAFTSGNNVVAVEMHQNNGTSSDLSFDLQLIGTVPGAATLTRGPYMNSALQSGIVIRWRTDVATNSKVSYGTAAGSLTQSAIDNTVTTEHVITLTGLTTNTLYYYSIGSTTQTLQGDANNYFKTMPVAGSTQKIRVLAMGDMGNNSTNQVNVRNAWQAFNGTNYTNAWLLMGDNAYNSGTDTEYQTSFFNIYQGSLTKNHVLWPSPGNHDYANSAARQADHVIPYYDMFTLPSAGQAGGTASGTEAFYSYNYGNVHFVALDSYGWEAGNTRLYDTLGPQAVWLKQDLAANNLPWTVVYFHHPPYTKGSHNSDTEAELISMRQNIVRILERYKVDLVLNGHSHCYERSYLINGHYGLESSFVPATHALSSSSAKYDGSANSCTYIKNATEVRNGIVYAVVGSSGQVGGSTTGYPHDAMYYSNITNGGALFFEVEANRLNAKWIGADGVVRDNFSIMKDVNKVTDITIAPGGNALLTASWPGGTYSWSTGETTSSITVSPAVNTTYTVADGLGCITDVFNITVSSGFQALVARPAEITETVKNGTTAKIYPTLLQRGQPLNVRTGTNEVIEMMLTDVNGSIISRYRFAALTQLPTRQLMPGTYFLKWYDKNKPVVHRFVVLE
ncbi:MAG TPA: Ig-like domain-containing protein [Ferruginibacter sp.]|nr:Ig-like domain-containing protein [Ferruginibacter sp.]